jgi:2-polyprenyl-6-hydroxyphenyl methylase/3-demethylubiquinone-9 3-methyltransferase
MLHRLNPVRLQFLRDAVDRHWLGDRESVKPLAGKTALDVGCGAGLLCEPLARLGAKVTGVDAAKENIEAAKAHAAGSGLAIDYRAGELAALGLGKFDLVTSMEVLEHVADKAAFVAQLAAHLAPGGLMVLSTPNRTPQSRLLLVGAAEAFGAIPKGTHHWDDFATPEELRELLGEAGLEMGEPNGITFSPMKGLHLSGDLALNYIVAAVRK